MENRIIELETRLAFQEDQLEQLNQVISQQQLELTEAQRLIRVFMDRVNELREAVEDGGGAGSESQERPPHY